MSFDSDLTACAALVEKADPDRFAAAMASPVSARAVLFPLYAFNVEVARAPWLTQESMIAEMRLQWWRDALEEIAAGQTPRRHEVITPLARILSPADAKRLDRLVAARRWDIYKDPFEDADHFTRYLDDTAGTLMHVAARSLCGEAEAVQTPDLQAFGRATGLARFLQAIPELEARGRIPLVDGRPEAIAGLATTCLASALSRRKLQGAVPPSARPALTEGFLTHPLLMQAVREPQRVARGRLRLNPFKRPLLLWLWS